VTEDEVLERFALMADLSAERAEKFRPLCGEAMTEISRRARSDDTNAHKALCAAAAALAFYRWALAGEANGPAGFALGEVKVSKNGTAAALAKEAWKEAEAAAAPYLEDDQFLFRGTML